MIMIMIIMIIMIIMMMITRLDHMEGENVSTAQHKRLELKIRELESKLELEKTTKQRQDTQVTRQKEVKIGVYFLFAMVDFDLRWDIWYCGLFWDFKYLGYWI